MFTLRSDVYVEGLHGQQIFDFFMCPTDEAYRRWWPGTHLEFHPLDGEPGQVGLRLLMDEYIGRRRVRMSAVVLEAEPGRRIVWQLEKFVRLPVWVQFDLADDPQGLTVTHTLRAGFSGWAAVFDRLVRLILNGAFERDMDEHVRTEFPRLQPLLGRSVA